MTVTAPTTTEQLRRCAGEIGLGPTAADAASFAALMAPSAAAYDAQDALPEKPLQPKYPRGAWQQPPAEESRCNAWYVKTQIAGAAMIERGVQRGRRPRARAIGNAAPFYITHDLAMAISWIHRAAHAFEQAADWQELWAAASLSA